MEHNLHCDEKFDQLPPSYSAVMAEKELDSLNINIKQASYEAQKMVHLLQFQSDFLQWKNKCYLDKIDEMNSFDIAQDALSDKLLYMNDLLEKLIQEAEVTLQTVPCSVKKKKRYTNYALLQSKYIESQQKLDMTLKEIMKTIDTIIPDTKPHYTSSLSSFVHNTVSNIFRSTKQKHKSSTQTQKCYQGTSRVIYYNFNCTHLDPAVGLVGQNVDMMFCPFGNTDQRRNTNFG